MPSSNHSVTIPLRHGSQHAVVVTYTAEQIRKIIAELRRDDYTDESFYQAALALWRDRLAQCTEPEAA